jgi:hypothetical protein
MCGAINDIEPEVTVTECPFCGSAQVRPEEEGPAILRPESLLPFAVGRDKAVSMFRQWLAGLWFRPSSLKKRAEMERIDGVYVPAWTFDCRTSSSWSADAGYHYTTTESYTAMQNGRPVTRTRTVVHTRWVPASGTHQGAYDDWLVQASKGLDQKALKELEPFDTVRGLVPYEERFLAGFKAERYSVNLDDAWRTARAEIAADVERACARMVPGDTHRNLHVSTAVSSVTFKHVLLPVWMASYQYKGKPYRYLVNGETGKATGTAPYSTFKLVAFAILVIAALFALARLTGNV